MPKRSDPETEALLQSVKPTAKQPAWGIKQQSFELFIQAHVSGDEWEDLQTKVTDADDGIRKVAELKTDSRLAGRSLRVVRRTWTTTEHTIYDPDAPTR